MDNLNFEKKMADLGFSINEDAEKNTQTATTISEKSNDIDYSVMFKGFVRSNGKAPKEAYAGKSSAELRTINNAKALSSYCGVLNDNIVFIDTDDEENSQILLQILLDRNIKFTSCKTTRGRHFYFLNSNKIITKPLTESLFACGIVADCKMGTKNGVDALKVNGVEREFDYNSGLTELPTILTPLLPYAIKNVIPTEIEEGTRNNSLFLFSLELIKAGLDNEDIQDCMELVNEYFLNDPISEAELNTIINDNKLNKGRADNKAHIESCGDPSTISKNKYMENEQALMVMDKYKFINIRGQIFMKNSRGFYEMGRNIGGISNCNFASAVMDVFPDTTARNAKSVVNNILMRVKEDTSPEAEKNLEKSGRYTLYKNGLYNMNTGELVEDEEEINKVVKFSIMGTNFPRRKDYDFKAAKKTILDWADGDEEVARLLLQIIADCTCDTTDFSNKIIFLSGDGANGKSAFMKFIKDIIGKDNYSSLSFHQLTKEKFSVSSLLNKKANFTDEVGGEYITSGNIDKLKSLSGANGINAEKKGQDTFQFINHATMIMACNVFPNIPGLSSKSLSRRLIVIPFTNSFKEEPNSGENKMDLRLEDRIGTEENKEAVLKLALDAYREVVKTGHFSYSKRSEEAKNVVSESSDWVSLFCNEDRIDSNGLDIIVGNRNEVSKEHGYTYGEENIGKIKDVYNRFYKYCVDNGVLPKFVLSRKAFIEGVCMYLGCDKKTVHHVACFRFVDKLTNRVVKLNDGEVLIKKDGLFKNAFEKEEDENGLSIYKYASAERLEELNK